MFDILKDELVGLMIRLSGEYRDGIPAVRLSQSNMKYFITFVKNMSWKVLWPLIF